MAAGAMAAVSSSEGPRGDGAAPPTKWSRAFEAILKQILQDYEGQEPKVRDGMATGMRGLFERPYEAELGALVARRRKTAAQPVSREDAQRIIFFPRLSDMQCYADVFELDTPEATKRREKLMKIKMVSVFYTLHRKDGTLMDRFMHCGGLKGLVALLADENPVIQSEAVELLLELLSPQMLRTSASSSRQAHLHHQIWLCLRSAPFWKNFAQIVGDRAERFPRSHENALRIMAGAIGWLRPQEGCIPEATHPPDVSEAAAGLQSYLSSGAAIPPDIRGVGEDLLAELLAVPKVREDPLDAAGLAKAREGLFAAEAVAAEDAAHAWQALRRLGNEAFGAGLVWAAEASYRLALEEGGASIPDPEASLICSNQALALLKAGHPAEAAEAAAAALARDSRNAKAAYRRAQGLLEQLGAPAAAPPSPAEAARLAAEAAEAAELAAQLAPKDGKVVELLERARAREEELRASALVAAAAEKTAPTPQAAGLDEMD